MTDEDIFMQKRLLDLSEQSYRNNHYTFTGFISFWRKDRAWNIPYQAAVKAVRGV